jgi:hypothetical protein
MFTAWPDVAEGADQAAASDLLASAIAERYFDDLMRWLEARPGEPEEWQQAAQFGDTLLWLTAGELAELGRALSRFRMPDGAPRLTMAGGGAAEEGLVDSGGVEAGAGG